MMLKNYVIKKIRTNNMMENYNKSIRFSICTLVNDINMYKSMIQSFINAGFNKDICEYLYIDNTLSNTADAYKGINFLLSSAKGNYIIICHQDIILKYDSIKKLEDCIFEIEHIDPKWALLGNAGGISLCKRAVRITDPHGADRRTSKFPVKVQSLDENFILIRKSANLKASEEINGFHLYGLDLCLQASLKGYSAYVIDFHLEHLSPGKVDNN